MIISPQHRTGSRVPDLLYGTFTGLLCVGLKAYWAMGIALTSHSSTAGTNSLDMGRMAVWGFLVAPATIYLSLMASYGASALWAGAPAFRWFSRPGLRELLSPLPADEITPAQAAGRGALGGICGLAAASVFLAAWLVICLVIMFLGPGPAILLVWLGVVVASAAVCVLWGGLIGLLIYCRHRFGWPVGIAAACMVIVVCNFVVGVVI